MTGQFRSFHLKPQTSHLSHKQQARYVPRFHNYRKGSKGRRRRKRFDGIARHVPWPCEWVNEVNSLLCPSIHPDRCDAEEIWDCELRCGKFKLWGRSTNAGHYESMAMVIYLQGPISPNDKNEGKMKNRDSLYHLWYGDHKLYLLIHPSKAGHGTLFTVLVYEYSARAKTSLASEIRDRGSFSKERTSASSSNPAFPGWAGTRSASLSFTEILINLRRYSV